MKTHALTMLEKIECLLYAIYIQSRIAMPSIQKATDEGRLFWRNVLALSGLNADKFDFHELVLEVRFSTYIEEIECFGGHIVTISKPRSWSSGKIRQDLFHDKIPQILPQINEMLSGLESPTYITRGHPA
jgi:hypothetical protein